MAQITHYLAHDPVGNTESYLTEFDSEIITRAAASGIVFIAVYDDGTREIVDGKDVIKPQLDDEPLRSLLRCTLMTEPMQRSHASMPWPPSSTLPSRRQPKAEAPKSRQTRLRRSWRRLRSCER